MNFKPGDKVWVEATRNDLGCAFPIGSYPGVIMGPSARWQDWWNVEIFGRACVSHKNFITPRDDPPPQQDPKQHREPTGEWDLCPWQPTRLTTKEIV